MAIKPVRKRKNLRAVSQLREAVLTDWLMDVTSTGGKGVCSSSFQLKNK